MASTIAELELAINILERIKYELAFPLMLFRRCSVKADGTKYAKLHVNRMSFISARELLYCLNETLPITPVEKYNNLVRYNETKDRNGYLSSLFNRLSYGMKFDDRLDESSKLVCEYIKKVTKCKKNIRTLELEFWALLNEQQCPKRYRCSMSCNHPSLLCDIVAEVDCLTGYLSDLISKVTVYKYTCILPDGDMYEARSACKSVYAIMEKITLLGMKPNR